MTILGQLALGLGFLLAIWGTVVGIIGGNTGRPELVQSARRAVYALFGVILILRGGVARVQGDTAVLHGAYRAFLENYDSEMGSGRTAWPWSP